jgi:hypothetical protein
MTWVLAFGAFMLGGTIGATVMAMMAMSKHPNEPFEPDDRPLHRHRPY